MIPKSNLLRLFDGNLKMVNNFISSFKSEAPKNLDLLGKQLLQKEWNGASITSHNLKTQCFYIGLKTTGDIAFKIEKMTENGNVNESCFDLYQELKRQLLDVIR